MSTASHSTQTPPPSPADTLEPADADKMLEQIAQRVDEVIAEIKTLPTDVQAKAMAMRSAIEEFHKVGLTLIVKRLKSDPRGKELLFELVDHPAVYALFSMHGLVRADLRTQVSRVLEMVRPYMQSHGGDVVLEDVRGKIVYVRLIGNCQGCSMSSLTLRNTVEESLKQHLPEIEAVKVVSDDANADPLVQIQASWPATSNATVAPPQVNARAHNGPSLGHGWVAGPMLDELNEGKPTEFTAGDAKILLVPTQEGLRAYRNSCAHQGLPLDGGLLDQANDTLVCPWHGFQFSASTGECLSAPQCQLEPFPLRIIENRIWVRPDA